MKYNLNVLIRMLKFNRTSWIIVILITAACSQPKTPQDVSASFWKSIQAMDLSMLYKTVASDSVKKYKLDDMPDISKVFLGDTVIEGDRAWVDTIVQMKDKEDMEIPVKTVLILYRNQWKVDYDETVQSLSMNNDIADLFSNIEELGDEFMESFNNVIDEYQKTVPEIERELKKLEDNIKSQIPEMKEKIEEFAKEIEKAIKNPPPPPDPAQPIEI